MIQYDLLLTQNVSLAGTEFSEKYVNITKAGLLSAIVDGTPTVLAGGTNGYQLIRDDNAATGLAWAAIAAGHIQNTDTGTTSNTFTIDSNSTTGKMVLDVALNAGEDHTLTITNEVMTGDVTITLPAITGTVALASQLHTQGTDTGTTAASFKLDSDGYKIDLVSESASKLGIKVDGDATYADLQVKDLTVYNLTVNGTSTIINSATLTVDDKNIELGSVDTPTDITADGGGITLKGATDKTILWDNANDNWTFNQAVNLDSGLTYKINNTTVLSATQVLGKTLGTMAEATATDYVAKALYDANTLLFATSNDTPVALLATELPPKLWSAVPADKIGTGYATTAIAGMIARDANWFYICQQGGTATNQKWSRSPQATNWP